MGPAHDHRIGPGVGVTKALFVNFSVAEIFDIHNWQVSSQLSCNNTCQIWTWYSTDKRFDDFENWENNGTDEMVLVTPTPELPYPYVSNTVFPCHEPSYRYRTMPLTFDALSAVPSFLSLPVISSTDRRTVECSPVTHTHTQDTHVHLIVCEWSYAYIWKPHVTSQVQHVTIKAHRMFILFKTASQQHSVLDSVLWYVARRLLLGLQRVKWLSQNCKWCNN